MTKRLMLAAAALALAGSAGCEALSALSDAIDPPPPKLKIGKRAVAVLPFTGFRVLRKHPDIERELGEAIITELKAVYPETAFIAAEDVAEWKKKTPNWQGIPAPSIGKDLGAGLMVEVNVVEFHTRPRADSVFVQAVLVAEVLASDVERQAIIWRLGRVRITWPADTTHTIYDTTEDAAKAKAIARFAERFTMTFARRFEK